MRPKPSIFSLSVVAAGIVLGVIAWRASGRTYVPPARAEAPLTIPTSYEGAIPSGFVVERVPVEGMCCDGCKGTLYERIMELEGVQAAAVDPILGQIDALVRTGTPRARLVEALTFDKYRALP